MTVLVSWVGARINGSIKEVIIMKKLLLVVTLSALGAFATACVTINVYFPEAEAERAADMFVGDVWRDESAQAPEEKPEPPLDNPQSARFGLLDFFIPAAHAQPDISIDTPAIKAIQERMKERFNSTLKQYYESGAVGLTNDALVAARDLSAVPLSERNAVNQALAKENADRRAVYREIAVANGHPEWEDRIRDIFADKWVEEARPGWWYQNEGGEWVQK